MWIQKRGSKFRAFERLYDHSQGAVRTFSVTMEKNTATHRKTAQRMLEDLSEATRPVSADTVTFSQLVDLYRKDQKITVTTATYKRNFYAFNQIKELFGEETLVSDMTASFIRSKMLESGKKPQTLNEYIVRLKAMFRWAYRNDMIGDISVLAKIQPFADKTKREKVQDKYLEKEELVKILAAIKDTKWLLFTKIMVLTGMRFGELSALKKKNIDLENRYIHVVESYNSVVNEVGQPKTFDSIRDIYIQDELMEVIKDTMELFDGELLFGGYLSIFAYNKYLAKHNPTKRKVTSHIFRHTHTSMLASQGVPFDAISRRLGHSDSKITQQVYFHVTEKLRERDNKLMEAVSLL